MKKILNKVLFIIFLGTFLFCAYQLYSMYMEYKNASNQYIEASKSVSISNEDMDSDVPSTDEEVKEPLVSLDVKWNNFNDKVVAWMQVKDSDIIKYPVVQASDEDPEYYLHHLYNDNKNASGSIFVDSRNDGFSNRHVIVYGHNMKDGSMFASIKKMREQSYVDEHNYIYVGLRDGSTRMYKVFSVFLTDARGEKDYDAYQVTFASDDDFSNWIEKSIEKSEIDSKIAWGNGAKYGNILTLSTCMSRGNKYERCVVMAIEVKNEK